MEVKKRHGKSVAREKAVQALYTYAITEHKMYSYSKDKFADKMVKGTIDNIEDINKKIGANLKKWSITEVNKVNLSILQLGIYELMYEDTPPQIVINEALNLAKKYSDIKSKNFIHSTLDHVYKGLND